MSDLNLIPQEIKIHEDIKRKRKRSIIIIAGVVVILIALTCLPFYLIYKTKEQNRLIEDEILKLSPVKSEISKINEKNKSIEGRMKLIEDVSSMEKKWTAVMDDLSSNLPWEISTETIDASGDIVSIRGVSLNYKAIAVFAANLEMCGKYSDILISDIVTDDESDRYVFNVSFKIKSWENKEK